MDALAALLNGQRARGAFLLRSVMDPPWSMRIEDEAPLTVVVLARGTAWITPAAGPPVELTPGVAALARGPAPYTVADSPDTPPQISIGPGQICRSLDGTRLEEPMSQGLRTWGNSPDGHTVMLTGTYETPAETARDLLTTLPPLLTFPPTPTHTPLITALSTEITTDAPGQSTVLDRLLDLLTITLLRTWLTTPTSNPPAWYQAHSDPLVGQALRLLHHNPAHPWTLNSLATHLNTSRSTLTRRFTALVGEPPITHLTRHRLNLAADLLNNPSLTLESIAHRVGYTTPYSLSTAFKRHHGHPPKPPHHPTHPKPKPPHNQK
ncbi:AraC family transcriptional regulator [Actinocorallia sp. A-T 12471]|uniref:AraC family transcriptional regulator n=1 Tax=Actinocorallia sp. A-T 12471 TaxID=3089813 RepID=UPI0029D0CB19|nr:AraC family transcriptional regulator [Actinocorallia sp. A-T 12471]MDX6743827.1 AraC family transcriptional regulator [Actinocorallia sp. A-T 12471]